MWQVELCRLAVDWEAQGAAWEHHLGVLVHGDTADWAPLGCTPRDPARTVLEYDPPHGGTLTSRLRVTRAEADIVCSAIGDGESATEAEQTEAWRACALAAFDRLGTVRAFTWQALVGTHPRGPNQGTVAVALAETARIGPLTLTPGGVLMHQMVPHGLAHTHRHGGLVHRSWPIYVEAEVTAFNWTNALGQAGRPLRRVNALLSLLWDGYWTLLEGPTTFAAADGRIQIPHVVFGAAGTLWEDKQFPLPDQERCREPRALPGGLDAVWRSLEEDQGLGDALDAYYEAVRLSGEHPSAAYAAFVAAIEAVGSRSVPLTACACCEDCRIETGATRRFRAALRTVLTSRQVKALAEEAYALRSSTAHTGALHGLEANSGQHEFSMYRADDRWLFGDKLRVMSRVARVVLATALIPEIVDPAAASVPSTSAVRKAVTAGEG
jgi:hypothetical protein